MLPPILLVEDSDDDAFFLERSLERAEIQCRLERAKNGEEALAYLQALLENPVKAEEEPVAIFLDLKMPRMNGFQVLEWMGERGLTGRWEVIVLSGSDQAVDIQKALEMGARAYLVKPASAAEIRECLAPRLERSEHESQERRSSGGER